MRSSGITVFNRDFQKLHSIHSTRRNPRDSSSINSTSRRQKSSSDNSTCRRQRDLLSSLQGIPAARPSTSIPVLHGHSRHSSHSWHSRHSSHSWHSSLPGITTRSSISLIRMQFLHIDWFPPETPLSANQYKTFYKHYILQRKGDVVISIIRHYSTE